MVLLTSSVPVFQSSFMHGSKGVFHLHRWFKEVKASISQIANESRSIYVTVNKDSYSVLLELDHRFLTRICLSKQKSSNNMLTQTQVVLWMFS